MFKHHKIPINKIDTEALIVPLFKDKQGHLSEHAAFNDLWPTIKLLWDSGEFTGKEGDLSLVHLPNMPFKRLILIGLGDYNDFQGKGPQPSSDIQFPFTAQERLRIAGGKSLKFALDKGIERVCVYADTLKDIGHFRYPALYYLLEGGLLATYSLSSFKGNPEPTKEFKEIAILDPKAGSFVDFLSNTIRSSRLARDLINSPSNHVTPTFLLEKAKEIKSRRLRVRCLSEKELQREGLNGVLAVAKGSKEPPRFIILEHKVDKRPPIVIVGKSVTFDSGGISLKPSEGLERMKYDMAGGAVVIALMKALVELDLKCNVVGILPAVENLPDAGAYKPGDVIKMMNGKTVEIVSTDAEGRMTLADALCYGIKYYKPSAIIDIATLTGACAITFGNEYIGMMGNEPQLMEKIALSGKETYERVWHMPLCDEYGEYIKGDTADIKNSGGREGSMLTAGYFLRQFVDDTPWAHLDIASTAWLQKDKPYLPKGASGSGMRLLLDFVMNHA